MSELNMEGIVAFCILMQHGEGILGKSPRYIKEKFLRHIGTDEWSPVRIADAGLDYENVWLYRAWWRKWEEKKGGE